MGESNQSKAALYSAEQQSRMDSFTASVSRAAAPSYRAEEAPGEEKKQKTYRDPVKNRLEPVLIGIYFSVCAVYIVYTAACFLMSVFGIGQVHFGPSLLQVVGLMTTCLMFILSTWCRTWNYEFQKKLLLHIVICLAGGFILRFFYAALSVMLTPILSFFAPNEWVPVSRWTFLSRTLSFFIPVFLTVLSVRGFYRIVFESATMERIQRFRLREHVDSRKNRRYLYDVNIVKDMKNGKRYVIHEGDRFYHSLVDGPSGTGKTATVCLPTMLHDLEVRQRNKKVLRKKLIRGVEKGWYYMVRPVTDEDFHPTAFAPYPKHKKDYDELVGKYRMAGMLYMAPDCSSTDQMARLIRAKGERVYLVDPETKPDTPGLPKDGFIALNPLATPENTPEWRKVSDIVVRATIFSTVLQKIFNASGKTDTYFESVNKTVTVAFAITLQAVAPYMPEFNGRQPNATDLQLMMNNNFSRVKKYYDALVKVNEALPGRDYQFVVDFLASEIIGDAKGTLYERSGGLRLIFNQFLANPLIRRTLCPEEGAPSLDIDRVMREGGLCVVNFSQVNDSTYGFGLFVLLYTIEAVFRRDGSEGSKEAPFFVMIDEAARLTTNRLDEALTQGRKFKVAFTLCLQTLDQMLKDANTKYLKGVLQQAAHHYVFGRCSTSEMRLYSELAGREYMPSDQETVTQSTITSANTSLTYSKRTSLQEQDILRTSKIRNLPFQEITLFTTQNGSPLHPLHCRVDFISRRAYNRTRTSRYDWDGLYSAHGIPDTLIPSGPVDAAIREAVNKVPEQDAIYLKKDGEHSGNETEGIESLPSSSVDMEDAPFSTNENNEVEL